VVSVEEPRGDLELVSLVVSECVRIGVFVVDIDIVDVVLEDEDILSDTLVDPLFDNDAPVVYELDADTVARFDIELEGL